MSNLDVQVRFARALESFTKRLREDSQVIAAILAGSLSYDKVWEKSDIDITVVIQEQTLKKRSFCLVEDGIVFNGQLVTRNGLKRWISSSLSGSANHSFLVKSTLLFTKDPSIEDIYADLKYVGSRDRDMLCMSYGAMLIGNLSKTEKWLTVKHDPTYAWVFFTSGLQNLAAIVTLINGEVPMREVIHQAIGFAPELFADVYTDMMNRKKTEQSVRKALKCVNSYVREHTQTIFKSMIDYLSEAADFRTMSEIDAHFSHVGSNFFALVEVCDWLAELGVIQSDISEVRLTPKSRSMMIEPAYISEAGLFEVEL